MSPSSSKTNFEQRFLGLFDVAPEERRPTVLLSCFLLLGMATVICLKAVSDATFLSEFNAELLPWVDLAVTVLVGLVVNAYLSWSSRMTLGSLITITQIFLAVNMALFWALLKLGVSWAPILIYVWVGIFAVLIPSQVWSLAGMIFTTRQAKRLFALIGSGGILGAALGGNFAGFVGPRIGFESVLPATIVFVVLSAWIARSLTRNEGVAQLTLEAKGSTPPIVESFRLVRSQRYLLLITAAIFASTVVGTLVKYQFKALAQVHFGSDLDALGSFSGYFYGYIAVISFLFHVLFTGRLLRWAGLSWCLFVLPLGLLLGVGALLFSTTIVAAVAARGADQGFRHSIDRAATELLYVPLAPNLRARVKSFLDMVVSRSADGVASVVLLGIIALAGDQISYVSWAGLVFIALWIVALTGLRREYVNTLRATIERRDIGADELMQELAVSGPSQELEQGLQSSDQRDLEAAVGWIRFTGVAANQVQVAALLTHESSAIRRKAMTAIAAHGTPGCEREALAFVRLETDFEARHLALDYVEAQNEALASTAEREMLAADDRELAAMAAARLVSRGQASGEEAERIFRSTLQTFGEGGPAGRATAARLIELWPHSPESVEWLKRFLEDDDAQVVAAALQSARALAAEVDTAKLIALLGDRRFSRHARAALVAQGARALEGLGACLRDESAPEYLLRQTARVLGEIGGREGSRFLLAYLRRSHQVARRDVLRALIRIRTHSPDLELDREVLDLLIRSALRRYYQTAFLLNGLEGPSTPASDFLARALHERLKRWLDEAFVLLGFLFKEREIRDAYDSIRSGRTEMRANGLEFLDSRLLGNPIRLMLMPALEQHDSQKLLEAGRQLFDLDPAPYASVLRRVLEASDPWLQSCACYVVADSKVVELSAAGRLAAQSCGPRAAGIGGGGLSPAGRLVPRWNNSPLWTAPSGCRKSSCSATSRRTCWRCWRRSRSRSRRPRATRSSRRGRRWARSTWCSKATSKCAAESCGSTTSGRTRR